MSAKVPFSHPLLRFSILSVALYQCIALFLLGVLPVQAQRVRSSNPPALSQAIPVPSLEQQLSRRLPPLVPGQTALAGDLLVGIKPGFNAETFATRLHTIGQVIGYSPSLRTLRVKLDPAVSDAQALTWLRQQGETAYAENNHRIQVTSTPNDASYSAQWALPKILANQAWDLWKPQGQVVLAIVDTGVDYTHPDLMNVIFRDTANNVIGYDATGSGTFIDGYGHGTHVAGSAAAQINNGASYQYTDGNGLHTFGTAGAVGWNGNSATSDTSHIKIMPVRVLNSGGSGTDAQVADGIAWAVDHGAQVISMSLGAPEDPNDPGPPATLNVAVQYAWSKGVVIVAAAGNDNSTGYFYPAACPNVISVAATDPNDSLAGFSNYGNWVNVAAPGVNVLSTLPSYSLNGGAANYYGYSSGTSMATPHVAAEAAMLRAQKLTLTNQQVRDAILGNVDPLTGGKTIYGGSGGRVNFLTALSAVSVQNTSTVRLNCGGPAIGTFSGDQYYNGGLTYTMSNAIDTSGVTNPAPQACYQSQRYLTSGSLVYAVPNLTASNSYTVRLHFAENYWTAANQRVMNISLNGAVALNNFDLVASAGGRYKACVKEFTTTADSSGTITITLGRVQGDPMISAIEILGSGSGGNVNPVIPPSPTGLTANAGNNSITLAWTAVSGATSYNVKRSLVSGGPYTTIATLVGSNTFVDGGQNYSAAYVLQAGTRYYYVVTAMNAAGESANSNEASAAPTATSLSSGIRINCGGPAIGTFSGDQYYNGGLTYTMSNAIDTSGVTNPAPQACYQSQRYLTSGSLVYAVPNLTASNSYTVRLHFAENYWTAANQRVMNISLNGAVALNNFDLVASAGGRYKACVKEFTTTADSSGTITITLGRVQGDPMISAIEIVH